MSDALSTRAGEPNNLPLELAQDLSPRLAQCEYRRWRAAWSPDEWAKIFWEMATIRPAMEVAGIDTAAIRELCEFAFARPKGDPTLVDTPDDSWRAASRAVTEFIAKSNGRAVSEGPASPAQRPPSLLEVIFHCGEAVKKHGALRPRLFDTLLLLPNGWAIRYKRVAAKGEPLLPAKVTHHTAILHELAGQPFNGIATVAQLETFAPFQDFEVLDPDGNRPIPETEPATVEMRLAFLLRELLENMKVLVGSLAIVESEAASHRWATDTTPLSRLAEALPVFPYWPRVNDRSRSYYDGILAEEKPLLNEALLALRRLSLDVQTHGEERSGGTTPKGPLPNERQPSHSADFTFVNWFGTEYTFALGVQSSAVQALWGEWERSRLGLHQDTIRNQIDAERDSFRMNAAFRNHPAFGTMIQSCGDGRYKLAPPREHADLPTSKSKKTSGIAPKSPQARA
jgi:hypothetical protein